MYKFTSLMCVDTRDSRDIWISTIDVSSTGIQASEAPVGARGKDHRETGAAAKVGTGEEEEAETSGD